MKLKKTKWSSLIVALFLNTTLANAANDYVLRIFNSTNQIQPLHYSVKTDGFEPLEGSILKGDDNGIALKINPTDKKTEIVLSDYKGKKIWDAKVSFYAVAEDFYTSTLFLAPEFAVGTHPFPSIHVISFDIISQ